jgi:hypothetical protein
MALGAATHRLSCGARRDVKRIICLSLDSGDPVLCGDPGFFCRPCKGRRSMGGWVRVAVLLACVALVGCEGDGTLLDYVSTPVPALTGDLSELEAQAIEGINAVRQERGLPALAPDARLTAAAQAHSRDMAARDFFDHEGSDGSQARERISAQGYAWRFYAENIARGHLSVDELLASWMESRPHRENLLSEQAEHVGVGVARRAGTDCTVYWTAVFAAEQAP